MPSECHLPSEHQNLDRVQETLTPYPQIAMTTRSFPRWAALLLSGCGAGNDESESSTSSSAQTPDTSPAELNVSVTDVPGSDQQVQRITVTSDEADSSPSPYDLAFQSDVNGTLEELQDTEHSTPEQPLMVLNPFGTNTTGLYVRFATEGEGTFDYTITSDGHETFSRTAKNHATEPDVFESQLIGLVAGTENTLTTTWRPDEGDPVENTVKISEPRSQAGYTNQLERDVQGDPEQLADGMFLLSGRYQAGPYGFLFDNHGTLRAELPIESHMLDRFERYEDTLIYPVGDHTLARVDGLGRVVNSYDLGRYEMHHDFELTENGQALILVSDTSRDSIEDILISLDLATGEYEEVIDFADLLKGYKDLTNSYEAPDSDGVIVDDWLHLNSVDFNDAEDSVIVSGRENSTIIKVGSVHGDPVVDYLIGQDELWEGSGLEDALLTKDGDFSDTGGQHAVFRMEDDSLEDGQQLLSIFDNSYWRILSREDYNGPVPEDATEVSGSDQGEDSHVRTYLVDENEGTYSQVDGFDVPYSSIVSSAQRVGDNTVVNSGQAFVLSEHDENNNVIATYSYDGENYSYRGMKYSFDDFWYES